ncbi:MAG TPA: CFI-box-CTERM domain-containing protein, partial [Nitrososphaera sp.]|nr:CFI-box-CTERM domain-containing protein [Nitrososphaera sp.]
MQKPPILASLMMLLLCLSAISAAFSAPSFAQSSSSSSSSQKGSYIDEARFILRGDENIALEEVKSGTLDMYFFRIPLESAGAAATDSRIDVYERSAGSIGLFVNPAHSLDESKLNPFESRDARYALNFLIDRDFVVNEILRGYGSPMVDAFGLNSPEYLNIIDIVESLGIRYNPAMAESMISQAMSDAGAVKTNDRWIYKGSPVSISILIRQDDAVRKSLGEVIASELEGIGFTVQRNYGDLNKANTVVYGSDPAELQWNLYTEGFAGTSAFVKYNPVVPAQMYAPWYGRMPGGQNPAFWYYQNATLDEVTQKILYFNFTSEQERNDLVRNAVRMGMQESVRLFIAQKTDPYVASANVEGLVNDFGAGITSKYSLANAHKTDGDRSLDIGVKQIYQGSWNIIAGLQDTYSRDIYSSIGDSGSFRHPYTGEIIPMRTEWTDVTTKGPLDRLPVGDGAVEWDAKSQQWKNVVDSESKSRVTFTPLYSNWHNGIPMDISDFMYSEYFTYEWGTNTTSSNSADRTYDPEFSSQAEVALQYMKGVKFSPDEIVTYIDLWHYDKTEIADSGVFWVSEPWEMTAAAERVVMDGKLAFSRTEATARGISWYDPIIKDHAEIIKAELQKMKQENFVPPALQGTVTPEQAAKRYDASIAWIDAHGHAVVSNGAFYLDSFNTAGDTITIKAFADPSYPFEQGHWSEFQNPKLAGIARVDVPRTVAIGQPATVGVSVTVGGEPSSDADVDYFLSGLDGSLVTKGRAQSDNPGHFVFELPAEETQKMSSGANQLKIFATGFEAKLPDVATNTIIATSSTTSVTPPTPVGGNQSSQDTGDNNTTTAPPSTPSGCLIATAAYGSELSPQVQYLRNFREQYILSTAAGSAFMNTFNAIYYSFSPQVADYERGQPWLQSMVKAGLYPLFGILMASERAHFGVGGG